jgi:hypothetical protein
MREVLVIGKCETFPRRNVDLFFLYRDCIVRVASAGLLAKNEAVPELLTAGIG